jgi:hypothetical protein
VRQVVLLCSKPSFPRLFLPGVLEDKVLVSKLGSVNGLAACAVMVLTKRKAIG